MSSRPIVLLTDFGTVDEFAGICEAVLVSHAPGSSVIHLTHGIEPQNVIQGSRVLSDALPWLPAHAVVCAVVDPGVGTSRRALAIEAASGRCFVGPDNGLLLGAVLRDGGAVRTIELDISRMTPSAPAPTFHGRDVFAPAAARIATGEDPSTLGTSIDAATLTTLTTPTVTPIDGGGCEAVAWLQDRYGNVTLWLDESELDELVGTGPTVQLEVRADRYLARRARTFGDVPSGELLLYTDPYGRIAIAVNQGNASAMFRLANGSRVRICPWEA